MIDRIHLNCNIFTQLLPDPQFFIHRFSDIEQQLLLFPEDATENCKCCQFRLQCLIGWWVRKVVMFVHNNGYFVHYCASSSNCNIIPSSVYSLISNLSDGPFMTTRVHIEQILVLYPALLILLILTRLLLLPDVVVGLAYRDEATELYWL
ncbi:unnamed protein product [Schistosoma mattheei]|uniref:Uncharacterized protein n=1 Tax=Schistosoma mattheei TaxID=31246 RepID=A0AA85B6X9_9TREM|nr:unnamed protein product [Schistosoma mattheei]